MRIALGIDYNGHDFYGWQAQENLPTIQGCLQKALSQIADEPIETFCAGRTDAGVHALGQVVHFDTNAERNLLAWIMGVNSHLPPAIAVRWAQPVDDDFHARFTAVARCYRYVIYNQSIRSAHMDRRASWYFYPLDAEKMHAAGQAFLGEQDFSSVRAAECESKTPIRNVHYLKVTRQGDFVVIEVKANAFLHHMVRNMVGVLLKIGSGSRPVEWVHDVLAARDRTKAAETAKPTGLYFQQVFYPEKYQFPEPGSLFIF